MCEICKVEKSLEEFQRNRYNPLGRAYWCKDCRRKFDRERNKQPERRLKIKEWEQSERGKKSRTSSRKADREKNGYKYKARRLLRKAVLMGYIIKKPCEVCGSLNSLAHHDDYSKPYDIIWLCRKHHSERHRNLKIE